MSELVLPRIKICGVTSLLDAALVVGAGADALGLIYAPSVRQVIGTTGADIVLRHGDELCCVGVFRQQDDHEILRLVDRDALRTVQLHDPASEDLLVALAERDITVIRALSASRAHLSAVEDRYGAAVLIDGTEPGSGVANDWSLVSSLHFDVPIIVAGGLTPDTVADVIEEVAPWGVDVASGVEVLHGVKDPAKVVSFVSRARAALTQKGTP